MLEYQKTPFLASFPVEWDREETQSAIEIGDCGTSSYDPRTQTSNTPLHAGTEKTYRTTRSGGPVLFSDDDAKVSDG